MIGIKAVDDSVEKLFDARNRVAIAIQILADYARDGTADLQDKDHAASLKKDLYGRYNDNDELGVQIDNAVKLIEVELSPIARLEGDY